MAADMSNSSKESSTYEVIDKDHANILDRVQTASSISISPEMFERLYLAPKTEVKGELRRTFGNPTPVALAGFLLCTTPLSMTLMGWRGAGGLGAANIGSYFFFGGMLVILGGVGEWILGNTFPAVVFMTMSAFWFSFGATLVPGYGAYSAYAKDPITAPQTGLADPAFFSTFAFFIATMAVLAFIYMIASVRTNVVFFLVFLMLFPTFAVFAAAFWLISEGNIVKGTQVQHAGGAMLFAISFLGWYIFAALVLMSVDFPIALPLGDLSTVIKGAQDRAKERRDVENQE